MKYELSLVVYLADSERTNALVFARYENHSRINQFELQYPGQRLLSFLNLEENLKCFRHKKANTAILLTSILAT